MSDARMRERVEETAVISALRREGKKKESLACNCWEFIRAWEISRGRGDVSPTVRITFTAKPLILLFIIGESLQNCPNTECGCYELTAPREWVPLFSVAFFFSSSLPRERERRQQSWKDKNVWIMSEGHRGSLFWQRIASECCATFNKRENVVWGEGVVGGGHYS